MMALGFVIGAVVGAVVMMLSASEEIRKINRKHDAQIERLRAQVTRLARLSR